MSVEKKQSLKLNMVLNAIKGIMGIVFPFISYPYVSRILGVENIGRYNFANSIINYFILFAGLGVSTYAIREGARVRNEKEKFEKFADEVFTINVISTVISYVALLILILFVSSLSDYKSLLIIFSLQIIFKTVGIEWVYSIYEDYAYITIRSILFQVISLVCLFCFVHTENDTNIYAAITVLANAGSNILNYFHARKYCNVRLTMHTNWKKHIKPILVLFAMSATTTIYVSSDTTILGFISGDYSVGIYSTSTKIYSIIKTVLSSVLVVSIPRLSSLVGKNDLKDFNVVATDIYKTLLTLMLPAVTGIILLRREIILIISSEAYLEATTSLLILSIALVACLGAWFWGQCILVPLKMENIVLRATIISAVVNIVLNFILIPTWAENAAAFTTLIAEGLAFIICMYYGRKKVKLTGVAMVVLKVGLGCLAIVGICLLIKPLIDNVYLYAVISVVLSVIAYFLIEILLKNECVKDLSKSALKKLHIPTKHS